MGNSEVGNRVEVEEQWWLNLIALSALDNVQFCDPILFNSLLVLVIA